MSSNSLAEQGEVAVSTCVEFTIRRHVADRW